MQRFFAYAVVSVLSLLLLLFAACHSADTSNETPTITLTPVVTNLNENADTSSPIVVATITVNGESTWTETLLLLGSGEGFFEIVDNNLRLVAVYSAGPLITRLGTPQGSLVRTMLLAK